MNSRIEDVKTEKLYKESGGIQRERISFKVMDTLPVIPTYIRAVVKSGIMGVKALTCDMDKIESDDGRLLRKEIADYRIKHIPLKQDTDINMKFKLNVTNNTMKSLDVFSGSIEPNGYFMPNLPIVRLSPKSYLKIDNIYVTEGISYNNDPAYTNCSAYEYKTLDYVPILYLTSNGLMYTKHCYYSDIANSMEEVFNKKILAIDPEYDNSMGAYDPDCYDIILDKVPKFYTGHESNIRHVYLSFDTFGTINAYEMVNKSIGKIVENLFNIKTAIESEDKLKVNIKTGKTFSLTIKQDMIWTAELVLQYIAEIAPHITARYKQSGHSNSEFTIHILHPEGLDIMNRILKDTIDIFENLRKSF